MKLKQNFCKVGLLLSALTLLSLTKPVMAGELTPFKGKEVFVDSTPLSFSFPFASNLTTAQGKATHIGQYTIIGVTVINVTAASATGTFRMVAANGDLLFLTMTGYALQPFSLKQTFAAFTVTGGTGRFEGATGSWTSDSHFVYPVNAGVPQNPYVAELTGAISSPKHKEENGQD